MAEAGFTIGSEFFPMPAGFRLADPVLVGEVTGLSWDEFATMLDTGDPRSITGMIAVAVWQKHPEWKRDKVARFVENIELDSIEATGGDDADPPPVSGPTGSDGSPALLTGSSAIPAASDDSDPASFGVPV